MGFGVESGGGAAFMHAPMVKYMRHMHKGSRTEFSQDSQNKIVILRSFKAFA